MKNKPQQVPTAAATGAYSLPALEKERQARLQLQQLFSQQPESCLQVIRRWLGSGSSAGSSTSAAHVASRKPPRPR